MRAISCPVKTHPEWKALVEEVGEARAYYLWDTMQDDNEFSGKLSSTISSPIFEINLDPFADNTRIMESMARVFSNYGLPINLYNKPFKDNEVLNSKNELTRISKEGGYLGEIANMILRKRLSETSRINLISLPENYLGLTESQPDQHTWHGSKVHKTDVALDPSNISLAQRRGLLGENAFDQTLVHEEVHRYTQSLFATYREMLAQGIPLDSNPEALSPSDINFIEEVTELYRQYMTVRKKNPKFKNAESTIDEFLAWGLTNPEFMEYLSTIKVENTSILEKLIEFLRRLFGGSINMQQALKQSFDNYMKVDAYVGTMLRSDELLKPATNSSAFNAFQELMVSVLGNESLPPISYMPYYLNWMKDHPFVMKAMEGFESEYDFIDHLLENPNNKWQKQFFKLLSQELFSQIDLNNFFLDLNKAYYNSSLEATDISIKEGVAELFESNPELANEVYEALGFVGDINKLKYQDFLTKIGEATELKEQVEKLKSYVEQFKTAYFIINIEEDIQSDIFFFKEDAEKALEEYNNRGDLKFEIDTTIGLTDKEIQVYKDVIEFLAQNPDQNPLNEKEYTGAKKLEEYLKYKHGLTSKQIKNILIGNKEKERLTDFINSQLELSQLQKIEGESGLPNNLTELELAKVTPQQKQQAQQLYAQYLESLNRPDTNPILQGNPQEQVKKFAELQERLNNKEFLEGAKFAFESSEELQELGTQEQYNDFIARVSLGIIKNPSSGEYNYESKVKDIVYHGTHAKFDKFERGKRNFDGRKTNTEGFHLIAAVDKEYYREKYKGLISAIVNFKNPVSANNGNYEAALEYLSKRDIEQFNAMGFDSGIKFINDEDGSLEYVAFEPEQIHILGSKQDIEGFKEFVDNTQERQYQKSQPSNQIISFMSVEGLGDISDEETNKKKQPPSKASVKGADQIYDSTAKTMSLEDWSKLLDLIVKKGISGGRFMEAINILKNQEDGFEEAFHLVLRSISEDPHYVMYMETALKRYGMASEKNLDEFVKENPHVARLSRTQLRTIYYDAKMARDYLAYKKGNKKLPKGILGRIFSLMDDVVDTSVKNKDQVLATLAETSKEITQEEQRYPVHEKYRKATYSRILKTDRRGAPITFEQSEMLIIQIANHVVEELEAISENFTAQITEDQYHAAVINAISEVRDRYAIDDILDEDGNILVEGWSTKLVRKYGKSPSKEGAAKILRVFETLYKILSVLPQDISVSPSGVLNTENPQDRRNLSVILNEVSKHVNFYLKSSQTIEQEMESEEDERGEAWNLAQYEEGGYMRIPERLKMLISRATYFEDEFGLGAALEEGLSLDEIEQMERYRKPVDAVRVYNAIIKVLSNTPKEMMIHKLKQYTEFSDNMETKKFFDFFLNQVTQELNKKLPNPITPIELRDASPETISFYMTLSPSLNMLLSAGQGSILPAFDILLDYNSGIYKVAESYQKDIEVAQIHRWRANLDAKNMSLEDFNDSITEVLSVMNSIFSEGESIRIAIPSAEELNGYISQIQEIFNKIGINFSKPFIKYSIIKENLGIIHKKFAQITSNIYDEDVTTSQVAEILELTKWVENYENVPHISREDLRTVRGRSKALGIPTLMIFGSEKDTKENRENETSSRFVNWAKGNSFFDESVTPSSYMNMESEYVQTYSPSFYYSEMIDEFRRGGNNTLREYIMSYIYPLREDYKHVTDIPAEKLTEALNKLEEYSVNNNPMPTRMHTLLTFNLLFNDPFFTFGGETISPEIIETHFSKMELAMLGGGRQQAMKETAEGEIELLRRRTMGKNFAKQTTADKILMEMTLFQRRTEVTTRAKRKPGEKERADGYQYVRMGINSEKRRQFIVKMPYFNSIDLDKGTLTSEGRAALRSLLKQEYEIIRNTYNQRDTFEKIPGVNVEYDDLMFKFKRMRTTNNEQMLLELEDRAKNENIPFEELVELVDDIIDTYVEDKVADFINEVNSTTNILYMAKKNDSMVYFSDSLPNYYKTEGKRTGTVNIHAIADYVITSTLVKTSLMNMLNLGSHFASYKDARTEVKRMSMGSAQGNNMGSGNSKVSIFESVELPIEAEEAQRHGFGQNGETVDSTDGIMYASIEWYMDIFLTSESAPDFVKKILRKSRRGYSLTDAEYNMLYRERAVPQSLKLQANTAYIGLKSSHATIIRSSVSSIKDDMRWEMNDFFDAWEELEDTYDPSAVYSGRFKKYAGYTLDRFKRESIQFFEPIPGREVLHNALNDMYTGKYDIYAASSASKKPTGNEYTVPNKFIRKQQDTYGFKNEITDPTQKRHLIHSEILDNAVVMANNIEMFGKEAVDYYKQLLAERININLANKRTQMLLMLGSPNYKRMLTDFAKTMERTNQSPYLLEMFSYNEETADPMYDLNLPSVVAKYEAMYLSLYTNGPLIQKAKGTKFTLLPDYGFQKLLLDGNPITTEQYKLLSEAEKSLVTTERLKHRVLEEDGNYYSEAMVSQAFTKLFGLKIGDNIPSELLKFMGVRIPTQDKHSMVNVKVVDILPGEYGNNIILPMELVGLTGWDFDIDAFYARVLTTYKLGEVPTPYGEYLNAPDATSAKIRAYYEYLHDLGQNNARMRDYLAEKGFSNTSAKSIMEGVAYFEEWKEIFGESDILPFDGKQAEKNWKAFQEGKYSEVKPLTKGEVDNHLLKLEIGLLHNSHNKEIAATPATRDLFAQRRELYIEMGIRNEENVHEPLSPGSQVKLESEISGGQEGVGIAAAFNVVFQYFAKSNPNITKGSNGEYLIKGEDGTMIRVNDIISQMISIMVDANTHGDPGFFNITRESLAVFGQLLLQGKSAEFAIDFINQPAVVQYFKKLENTRATLAKRDVDKKKIMSIVIQEMGLKGTAKAQLTETDLLNNLINPEDSVQLKALNMYEDMMKDSQLVRSWATFLSTASRGLGSNLSEAFKKKDILPDDPHTLEILEDNPHLSRQAYIVNEDAWQMAEQFLIGANPFYNEILDALRPTLSEVSMNVEDGEIKLRNALTSFMYAKAIRNANKVQNNSDILFTDELYRLIGEVKNMDEFLDNKLLNYLEMSPVVFEHGSMAGLTFHNIRINTRRKEESSTMGKMMDDYSALFYSDNPKARDLAEKLRDFLLMRDAFLYKNGSYINTIDPRILRESGTFDITRNILSILNDPKAIMDTFGATPTQLMYEFHRIFVRASENKKLLRRTQFQSLFKIKTKSGRPTFQAVGNTIIMKYVLNSEGSEKLNGLFGAYDKHENGSRVPLAFSVSKSMETPGSGLYVLTSVTKEEDGKDVVYNFNHPAELAEYYMKYPGGLIYAKSATYQEKDTLGSKSITPYYFTESELMGFKKKYSDKGRQTPTTTERAKENPGVVKKLGGILPNKGFHMEGHYSTGAQLSNAYINFGNPEDNENLATIQAQGVPTNYDVEISEDTVAFVDMNGVTDITATLELAGQIIEAGGSVIMARRDRQKKDLELYIMLSQKTKGFGIIEDFPGGRIIYFGKDPKPKSPDTSKKKQTVSNLNPPSSTESTGASTKVKGISGFSEGDMYVAEAAHKLLGGESLTLNDDSGTPGSLVDFMSDHDNMSSVFFHVLTKQNTKVTQDAIFGLLLSKEFQDIIKNDKSKVPLKDKIIKQLNCL